MPEVESTRPRVLTFVSYYLPGFKAGGPVTTIQHLVEQLGAEYQFLIVTRDHDYGDPSPYQHVQVNQWSCHEDTDLFYLSGGKSLITSIYRLLTAEPHDIIYLNSFFDLKLSFIPNLIRRVCCSSSPVILAPRGEFSGGALSFKRIRKRLFILGFKLLGMSKSVTFQASSEHEKEDIRNTLNVSDDVIKIASDLPASVCSFSSRQECSGLMRVVFLSRISPMKNLKFAIQSLQQVVSPIVFNIYGPLEDQQYWQQCESLLRELPEHIEWRYCGVAQPSDVRSILAAHDLMYLPSLGENFGHVIAESISVGTSVLISDRTPWRDLESRGFGWDYDLADQHRFAEKIDNFAQLDSAQRAQIRELILDTAVEFLCTPQQIEDNRMLFECLLHSQKSSCS